MLSNETIIIEGEDSISSTSNSASDIDEFMESIEDLIEKNKHLEKTLHKLEAENKLLSNQIHLLQNIMMSTAAVCSFFVFTTIKLFRLR